MKYLHIEYSNPINLADSVTLNYRLRDNPVVDRWVDKVLLAQKQYPIDDPARFYGFGSIEEQIQAALNEINRCITILKIRHPAIAAGYVDSVNDQDKLNYWHHVFETYHGLLDKQDNADNMTPVLSDLNLAVHRCESIARGAQPRHVVTYYGLPKDTILDDSDYEYFTDTWEPGTVLLNYAEIGKTLADLAYDNDNYIGQGAFQPFRHYSADFTVRFFAQSERQAVERRAIINTYYESNKSKFGSWQPCFVDGSVLLATLEGPLDLSQLESRQYVKTVSFT